MRLPILIEHFQEHKSKTEDLSFIAFLTMHYESDVAHDDTDNSLPFKGHDHSCCSPSVMLPFQKLALSVTQQSIAPNYSSFCVQREPALRVADIFQPPKL